jgi:hypothetical protein
MLAGVALKPWLELDCNCETLTSGFMSADVQGGSAMAPFGDATPSNMLFEWTGHHKLYAEPP